MSRSRRQYQKYICPPCEYVCAGPTDRKHEGLLFIGQFDTPEHAFLAYKKAKEEYIKEVAQEYYNSGKIDKKVHEALLRYQIEITD